MPRQAAMPPVVLTAFPFRLPYCLLKPCDWRISGTLDDALGPEAAAANRESVSATILLVLFQEGAPAAQVTRREPESSNLLPKSAVFVGVPDFVEIAGANIAKSVGGNCPPQSVEIGLVRVKQAHAWTDSAVPADKGTAFPDETAGLRRDADRISHEV